MFVTGIRIIIIILFSQDNLMSTSARKTVMSEFGTELIRIKFDILFMHLARRGIINDDDREFLSKPHVENRAKAIRLHDVLMRVATNESSNVVHQLFLSFMDSYERSTDECHYNLAMDLRDTGIP